MSEWEETQKIELTDGQLEKLYAGGNWFMFPRSFLLIMDPTEAVLMAYLINYSNLVRAREKKGGWFYCKKEKIHSEIFVHPKKLQRTFSTVIAKGYLETEWRSQPGKRWMKVNVLKIFADAARVYSELQNTPQEQWDHHLP